mmetsp:Transcript_20663/g.57392  ORF Transcript_20663/g.57392 Transcript_20663/m.57392 type:complete len:210 (-) Transcript_20663:664-1293(-)
MSFCVDLRRNANANANANIHASASFSNTIGGGSDGPRLVLSKTPLIAAASDDPQQQKQQQQQQQQQSVGVIPLVRDLRKRYGAPIVHYTDKASRLVVNGLPLLIKNKQPLYVIFDTDVSDMVVSQDLFKGRYLQARKNLEKSLWIVGLSNSCRCRQNQKQFEKWLSELNFPAKKGLRPQNDARVALGKKNGFKRPVATGFGQPPWSRSK